MKKIAITGLTILLVMFVMTCDAGFPKDYDDSKVDYTDVVYSEDGTEITLYLDGVGVPVTKAQREAQRAMTRRLAMMSYDYLEVVFQTSDTLARSTWELGQSAGISGVKRKIDYSNTGNTASIFVGRKDGKTLLGVGGLTKVKPDPQDSTLYPGSLAGSSPLYIQEDSTSVTFSVSAILTGLVVAGDDPSKKPTAPVDLENHELVAYYDSFTYTKGEGGDFDTPSTPPPSDPPTYYDTINIKNSSRFPLGSSEYPLYSLPKKANGQKVTAKYTFGFVQENNTATGGLYKTFIKHYIDVDEYSGVPVVQMRIPRYMDGGRYMQPKADINTDTVVKFRGAYLLVPSVNPGDSPTIGISDGDEFEVEVPLIFYVYGSGVFSFYIEIPVYNVIRDNTKITNSGPDATKWYIRTGLGSELYSLDTGKGSGGCVLMGIGVTALDWLEIEWEFLK